MVVATTEVAIPSDGSVTSIGEGAFNGRGIPYIIIPKAITKIGSYALANMRLLENVYYAGSESEFDNMTIEELNLNLKAENTYFYSEGQPSGEGNFWHYVGGKPAVWQ